MTRRKLPRQSNLELFRIVSMFMIVALHFVAQSGARDLPWGKKVIYAIFLGNGGRLAVLCFVILGAYFLVDSDFKCERIIRIWLETFFYCFTITLLVKYTGLAPVTDRNILQAAFPVFGCSVWYPSTYIGLLFISPALNFLIHSVSKRFYQYVIGVSLLAYSILPTVLMGMNPFGTSLAGFIVVYLLVGYLKKYPLPILSNRKLLFLIAIGTYLFIFLFAVLYRRYELHLPLMLREVAEGGLFFSNHYESIPAFVCAFALFFWFKNLSVKYSRIINTCAKATFGIYVMHQVPVFLMPLWHQIFKTDSWINTPKLLPGSIVVIFTVFIVGVLIDFVRQFFETRLFRNKFMIRLCGTIDHKLNFLNKGHWG
ncbi:MAG: acyltransferase [Roseburia sp.]|nr:acyltransferase [Roseburia sp.]